MDRSLLAAAALIATVGLAAPACTQGNPAPPAGTLAAPPAANPSADPILPYPDLAPGAATGRNPWINPPVDMPVPGGPPSSITPGGPPAIPGTQAPR